MRDLGKLIVAKGFKSCPKCKKTPNLVILFIYYDQMHQDLCGLISSPATTRWPIKLFCKSLLLNWNNGPQQNSLNWKSSQAPSSSSSSLSNRKCDFRLNMSKRQDYFSPLDHCCANPASFIIFSVFSNKHDYNFTTNVCEKCPSSIWCLESNFQPTWVFSHDHWTMWFINLLTIKS